MPRQKRNPFIPRHVSPVNALFTPTTVGTLAAATMATYPRMLGPDVRLLALPLTEQLPGAIQPVTSRLTAIVVGFAMGYGLTKCANWVRWKALKMLFSYHGWIYAGKSFKTKVWGLLVRTCKGSGPHTTYKFQNILPKLPLPELDETLDLWLEVSKELISREEYEMTKDAVERFRNNEGPQIQAFLRKKADTTVNWLTDYWNTAAYLCNRSSLMESNYFCVNQTAPYQSENQLAQAATLIRNIVKFKEIIDSKTLVPIQLLNLIPLCMNGYRYIYNTVRLPGENIDTMQRYPGENYTVVIRKGHYFILEVYGPGPLGQKTLLSAEEIKTQLETICRIADGMDAIPPVAVLTTQNRTTWAKHREILGQKNADALHAVEACLFMTVIDERPYDDDMHDISKAILTGYGNDRWMDKCFTGIHFTNGVIGHNVEHTLLDALVMGSIVEYAHLLEKYDDTGDVLRDASKPLRDLVEPKYIQWNFEDVTQQIADATISFQKMTDDLDLRSYITKYGKGFMKKKRFSPDGYMQMAIQLTYYKIHKEITKTYEPATSRMFALGRTETIHPTSADSNAFVQAMTDPNVSKETIVNHLKKAVAHQAKFRLNATVGKGCDRHLLGLYCASREMGMDVPAIFLDKAWRLPFKLSTSQTPTRVWELGADVVRDSSFGGFLPGCPDGYGVSYVSHGDDVFNITLTSWHSCEETDSRRFAAVLEESMEEMKQLLD